MYLLTFFQVELCLNYSINVLFESKLQIQWLTTIVVWQKQAAFKFKQP